MPQDIRPPGYFPQGTFIVPTTAIERRRRLAQELAKTGGSGPVQSWTQGAARLAGALGSVLQEGRADQMEQGRYKALQEALSGGATAEQLMATGDELFMQLGQFKALQQQRGAQAASQAADDAESRRRFELTYGQREREIGGKPPHVQTIKQADGSEVVVQWNGSNWEPMPAPRGGAAIAGHKPLTEGQSKDIGWYTRATGANDLLNKSDTALTDITSAAGAQAPSFIGNYLKTPDYRAAEGYGKEWLATILRKDSGAQITGNDLSMYAPVYLPQPGDGPPDIERKRAARQRANDGLRIGLSAQKMLTDEIDAQRQEQGAPGPQHPIQGASAPTPAAPAEVPPPAAVPAKVMGNVDSGNGPAPLPQIMTPADFVALPSGTHFLDPNGDERVKP